MPDAITPTFCLHCGKRKPPKPINRGLCSNCYYNHDDIRSKYPASRYAYRTATPNAVRPASAPTRALPGTEKKIAVFEERAAKGEFLYHPLDAKASEA